MTTIIVYYTFLYFMPLNSANIVINYRLTFWIAVLSFFVMQQPGDSAVFDVWSY